MLQVSYIADAMRAGARIGSIGMDKRVAGLTAIVARLYSLKGMGGSKEAIAQEIALAVKELERDVAVKYPFMTMAELQYALESGVKGELDDEPTYLSVANYCRWLSIYRRSDARKEGVQVVENGLRVAAPAMQLEAGTVDSRNAEAAKRALGEYTEEIRTDGCISHAHLDGAVASVYDYLRASGAMPKPAPAQIQAAMHKAASARVGSSHEKTVEGIIAAAASTVNAKAKRYLLEDYLKTRISA